MNRVFIRALVACGLVSGGVHARLVAGTASPAEPELRIVQNDLLTRNGGGIQRRFFFRIYELSLFLKTPSHDADAIIASNEPRMVEMTFLRDLTAAQVGDAFRESYAENCGSQCEEMRSQLETFLQAITDLKEGTRLEFLFLASKLVVRFDDGRLAEVPSGEFGRVLLRTWLGSKPASSGLKSGLLGG